MSSRPMIDQDIRVIWLHFESALNKAHPELSTADVDEWLENAGVAGQSSAPRQHRRIRPGRRPPSGRIFPERLQMTKAEKTAILLDALERQIGERDKELNSKLKAKAKQENNHRREHGLRTRNTAGPVVAWGRIAERLEADRVSSDFRRVVARFIGANVLSTNGGLPSALDREDAKRSYDEWRARLDVDYSDAGLKERENLAYRLVALDHLMDLDGLWDVSQINDWDFYAGRLDYLAEKVRSTTMQDGGEKPETKAMRRLLYEVQHAEIITL